MVETNPIEQKVYLGDSVYAEWSDRMIRLTTENGFGPSNEIFLEPEVFEALVDFAERRLGARL